MRRFLFDEWYYSYHIKESSFYFKTLISTVILPPPFKRVRVARPVFQTVRKGIRRVAPVIRKVNRLIKKTIKDVGDNQ